MILEMLHSPTLYQSCSANVYEMKAQRENLMHILQDARSNAVLLTDEEGRVRRAISEAIAQWPQSQREGASTLLEGLENSNRIVRVPRRPGTSSETCAATICEAVFALLPRETLELYLAPADCGFCGQIAHRADPSSYSGCGFLDKQRALRSFRLDDGAWDRVTFERQVWQPLLRHARMASVFDRNIGRTLQPGNPPTVKRGFDRGVRWLLRQYANQAGRRHQEPLRVYCALSDDGRIPPLTKKQGLEAWAAVCSRELDHKMIVEVRLEEPPFEMQHDRYLVTDQFAVQIGIGFDLLDKGRIKGTTITIVEDPGDPLAEFSRLEEIS